MPNLQILSGASHAYWRRDRLPLRNAWRDLGVADTVFAEAKARGYTREQWEVALEKAEDRIEPDAEPDAEPDEWPLIITDDFF